MQRLLIILPILLFAVMPIFSRPMWADDRRLDLPEDEIEADPLQAAECNSSGLEHVNAGEYGEALRDFSKAVKLDPENSQWRNNRAFLRATCPEARYRDASRAIADATKACELEEWKGWRALDTLAAAYAEKGDFEQAKKWQSKAIDLTRSASAKRDMKSRLELFAAGKPYRQATTK